MKSREEHLAWAKQRALICVDTGAFACAVAGLRVDLAENRPFPSAGSSGYVPNVDLPLPRSASVVWLRAEDGFPSPCLSPGVTIR
jgi:hypothetical protein